jgi:hypothetical protein
VIVAAYCGFQEAGLAMREPNKQATDCRDLPGLDKPDIATLPFSKAWSVPHAYSSRLICEIGEAGKGYHRSNPKIIRYVSGA